MEAIIVKMVASINLIVEMVKGIFPGMDKKWKIIVSFVAGIAVGIFFNLQGLIDSMYAAIILGLWSAGIASGLYQVVHGILKDARKKLEDSVK